MMKDIRVMIVEMAQTEPRWGYTWSHCLTLTVTKRRSLPHQKCYHAANPHRYGN